MSLAAVWANPVAGMPRTRHNDRLMYNLFMLTLLQTEENARLVPEKLRIFLLLGVVNEPDVLVRNLLNLVEPLAFVVFRNLRVFQQFFQTFVRIAADAPHRVASLFGELVHMARQLLAALLGERRKRDPYDFTVVRRIQSEIGNANRTLNCRDQRRIERLRDD